jgi:hypothetical protein
MITINIIESSQAGVLLRTNRVSRWRDGKMVRRWVAAAFLATEKNLPRVQAIGVPGGLKPNGATRLVLTRQRWQQNFWNPSSPPTFS